MHRLPNSMTRFTAIVAVVIGVLTASDTTMAQTAPPVRACADIEDNWCIRFEPIIGPVDAGGHAEMHTQSKHCLHHYRP